MTSLTSLKIWLIYNCWTESLKAWNLISSWLVTVMEDLHGSAQRLLPKCSSVKWRNPHLCKLYGKGAFVRETPPPKTAFSGTGNPPFLVPETLVKYFGVWAPLTLESKGHLLVDGVWHPKTWSPSVIIGRILYPITMIVYTWPDWILYYRD